MDTRWQKKAEQVLRDIKLDEDEKRETVSVVEKARRDISDEMNAFTRLLPSFLPGFLIDLPTSEQHFADWPCV